MDEKRPKLDDDFIEVLHDNEEEEYFEEEQHDTGQPSTCANVQIETVHYDTDETGKPIWLQAQHAPKKKMMKKEEYFEEEDPDQPSTSNNFQNEKFHYNTTPCEPPSSLEIHQKPRCSRGSRGTSMQITEAAKANGMQTVDRFGNQFVIPITMQAHPLQINDRLLEEKDDILSQTEPLPYCCHCHSIFKTWRGFEYHVLKIHLKYRPFRCYYCQKECFYTEEEGRFHASTIHPNEDITLIKEFNEEKEVAAQDAFKNIFLMCRDGPKVTKKVVLEWERDAAQQVMKFHYLRFKKPIVLTKKFPSTTREMQTEKIRVVHPPLLTHDQQTPHIFHNGHMQNNRRSILPNYPPPPHPHRNPVRQRSTATLPDEDPRDREKRVRALLHAVAASRD